MYLEQILGSDTRVKILRTLFEEALPQLDASALVAETGRSQGGVHQALKALEGTGVIRSHKRGRTFHYTVNPDHAYVAMLQELFARERARDNVPHLFPTYWNHLEAVVSKLARAPEVQLVLLYGSLTRSPIRGQADVDLLVGTDGRAEPPEIGGRVLGHPVSVVALPTSELEAQTTEGDPFIGSVLRRHVVLYRDARVGVHWLRTTGMNPE